MSLFVRPASLVPAAVALAFGLLSLAARRQRAVLLAAALFAAGWWWGSARLETLDRSALVPYAGRTGFARVEVTGPGRESEFALRVPVRVVRFGDVETGEPARLELPPGRSPPQGAVLDLVVAVRLPRPPEAHGAFDEAAYLKRQGIHVVLHAERFRVVGRRGGIGGVADAVRRAVARSLDLGLEGERRAVVAGVVLGEDEGLDRDLRERFRSSGLYHLLRTSTKTRTLAGVARRAPLPTTSARAPHVEGGADPHGSCSDSEGLRSRSWTSVRLESYERSPQRRPRSGGGTVKRDGRRRRKRAATGLLRRSI